MFKVFCDSCGEEIPDHDPLCSPTRNEYKLDVGGADVRIIMPGNGVDICTECFVKKLLQEKADAAPDL